jgi:hypothetical protein
MLQCVCRNIAARGLEDAHQLPQSDLHDSVICGIAADVNYDGADEVVIGTYGQSVMVYAQKEAGMCHDSGLCLKY